MSNVRTFARIGALVAAAAVVVSVAVLRRSRTRSPPRSPTTEQGVPPEQHMHMPFFEAMIRAPEGTSPCETAYNAIQAAQDEANREGTKPVFAYVAPHAEFVSRCQALAPDAQACMAPRYLVAHREACALVRPPDSVLNTMRTPADPPPPPPRATGPAGSSSP